MHIYMSGEETDKSGRAKAGPYPDGRSKNVSGREEAGGGQRERKATKTRDGAAYQTLE